MNNIDYLEQSFLKVGVFEEGKIDNYKDLSDFDKANCDGLCGVPGIQ